MASTALLDATTWDLVVDLNGNIAVATEPYSIAQDVASALRLVLAECWYDVTIGVPYFNQILGQKPPIAFMKAQFVAAALTVPDVTSAVCYLTGFTDRTVTGQVQVKTASDQTFAMNIGAQGSFTPAFSQDYD